MICELCGKKYTEAFYKDENTDEIICEDCLLQVDGITTETTTCYYLDGEYIGNDTEIDEVIDNICNCTSYKKVEEDF